MLTLFADALQSHLALFQDKLVFFAWTRLATGSPLEIGRLTPMAVLELPSHLVFFGQHRLLAVRVNVTAGRQHTPSVTAGAGRHAASLSLGDFVTVV